MNLTSVLLIRQSDSGAPICAHVLRRKADTLNTNLASSFRPLLVGHSYLWPPCVADADILFLPCGFFLSSIFFYLFFIPRLISAAADWMSTILLHMVWPCANLECRTEMCCTRLAGNTGGKSDAKNRHLCTIAQLCGAISSQLRHVAKI